MILCVNCKKRLRNDEALILAFATVHPAKSTVRLFFVLIMLSHVQFWTIK